MVPTLQSLPPMPTQVHEPPWPRKTHVSKQGVYPGGTAGLGGGGGGGGGWVHPGMCGGGAGYGGYEGDGGAGTITQVGQSSVLGNEQAAHA